MDPNYFSDIRNCVFNTRLSKATVNSHSFARSLSIHTSLHPHTTSTRHRHMQVSGVSLALVQEGAVGRHYVEWFQESAKNNCYWLWMLNMQTVYIEQKTALPLFLLFYLFHSFPCVLSPNKHRIYSEEIPKEFFYSGGRASSSVLGWKHIRGRRK